MTKTDSKICVRCNNEREHASNDYMCTQCRFDSDHRFTRDGHTVSFMVGHHGFLGVQVECPYRSVDNNIPCWVDGDNSCLVAIEMYEHGPNPLELITDPHGGDYEITSDCIPIEWYYHSSRDYNGEWDCEFGWRIADGPEPSD